MDQSTNDDAAVIKLDSDLLVSTVDFFSPVVSDPYLFGAIAAANALSDVYAMGGEPRICLAIAGFPSGRLSEDESREIMRGAIDKCAEASVVIAGGHTIESVEPFFGLAVNGVLPRSESLRRNVIRAEQCHNDVYLVLTKKLGVGMLTTALKRGILQNRADFAEIYAELIKNMADLNFLKLINDSVIALTDVTGFGLAGHLCEMLAPEGLSAELFLRELPVLRGSRDVYDTFGSIVLVSRNNVEYAAGMGYVLPELDFYTALIADPVTSGGLLFAVKGWRSAEEIARAYDGAVIGSVFRTAQGRRVLLTDSRACDNAVRSAGIFK